MTATMALHALLDDKHRWAWKIIGLCLLLGIAGQLVPSYLLRESPGERRTNLAVAQAELHRKSDLVRAKYAALQEELDVFQTSISDVLKAMAWRKVREEDFNAERVQHIQGVRDYMAERQAKMETMVLEAAESIQVTFRNAHKQVGYVPPLDTAAEPMTPTDEPAAIPDAQEANPPAPSPYADLPTVQLQPASIETVEPKPAPAAPAVLPQATPAPAPRPVKPRPKATPTPAPSPPSRWLLESWSILQVAGGLSFLVFVLAMLSVLYEQQVQGGYPFTPRKKTRQPASSRRPSGLRPAPGLDRITRNMNQVDFGSLEDDEDDEENTRGSYYATEGELLTPVPVRRSRRLHPGAPSVYLG